MYEPIELIYPESLPESKEEMREYVSHFTSRDSPSHVDFWLEGKMKKYGLSESDINYFKYHDKELKEAIDKFTGMDFPVHTIDGSLIIEFAGMVQKLGVDGAVLEARKMPRRVRALIRAICRNHKAEARRI